MSEWYRERKRLIRMMDERKEFVQDVDGFVYYWPEGSPNGHLSEHHLRWIADELKERNKEWQTIVDTMPHNAEVTCER
jgi:3',5'-cyclic AMP phosphodiesterase CpdA